MNVLGEGVPSQIFRQISVRQQKYSSGYNTNRTPEEIIYLNANTSWCKLVSSVDITNSDLLQDESLRGIEGIGGDTLAKKFVLFNGVSENVKETITTDSGGTITRNTTIPREGIDTTRDIFGANSAYGIGGTEFGLRPMMGIRSAEIKHENRGSIRRATVKIKAFNKIQFDIIDVLYLRLGFSVLLEWGHTMYYDNDGVLQKGSSINNSLAGDFLDGNTKYTNFLEKISFRRLSSNGNYDAMFAKVCNYHWSFLPDGSYDITLDLVSVGDIIESFKINALSKGVSTQTDKVSGELTPKEVIALYANKSSIGQYFWSLIKNISGGTGVVGEQNSPLPSSVPNSVPSTDAETKLFYEQVLIELGAPLTDGNLILLYAWGQAEFTKATWNPLATTLRLYEGEKNAPWSSRGVKDYLTFEMGVKATVYTIKGLGVDSTTKNTYQAQKYYWPVWDALKAGIPDQKAALNVAIEQNKTPKGAFCIWVNGPAANNGGCQELADKGIKTIGNNAYLANVLRYKVSGKNINKYPGTSVPDEVLKNRIVNSFQTLSELFK